MPSPVPPNPDLRKYVRINSVFPVQVRILNPITNQPLSEWLQGFTSNLGKGGICLAINHLNPELSKLIKDGQVTLSLGMQIPLSQDAIPALAKVVWMKEVLNEPGSFLLGLSYLQIDAVANQRIMGYARAKQIFIPVFSALVLILALGFLATSLIHVKSVKESKAIEYDLQSRIQSLQSKIETIEASKAKLEEKIGQAEKGHLQEKSKLEAKISLNDAYAKNKIKELGAILEKFSKEKADLAKQLSLSIAETQERGIKNVQQGNYDQAISELGKVIALNPDKAEAYNVRGLADSAKGEFSKAIADFSKAIEFNPGFANLYINRGNIYVIQGDPDKAMNDFNKAIELEPNNAANYSARGNAYKQQVEFDKAILDFTKAIEMQTNKSGNRPDPMLGSIYSSRADAYYQKEEYDKARDDLKKAIDLGAQVNPQLFEELNKTSDMQE